MDFNKMDLAQLQTTHQEMLATAKDLGLETLSGDLTSGFGSVETGRLVCAKLHGLVQSKKAENEGLAKATKQRQAPATTATKAKAAGTKPAAEKAKVTTTTTEKKTMATKKTAKKTKAKGKKAAAKKNGQFAAVENRKYKILAKENPYRKGTTRAIQFDKLSKYTDTDAFKKAGGEVWILRIAADAKFAQYVK